MYVTEPRIIYISPIKPSSFLSIGVATGVPAPILIGTGHEIRSKPVSSGVGWGGGGVVLD